jgi:hypothetical protein
MSGIWANKRSKMSFMSLKYPLGFLGLKVRGMNSASTAVRTAWSRSFFFFFWFFVFLLFSFPLRYLP